eukprot:g6288.t1
MPVFRSPRRSKTPVRERKATAAMLSDTLDSISTSPDTGVSYAIAYASLYVQWDGLFGVDGLEPAGAFLKRNPKEASLTNLFGYRKQFGFSADTMADALCILGFVSSIVAAVGPCNIVTMALSWLPYISLYGVGQTFLSFQWDILLLEVGVLAVMWAPPRLFSSKNENPSSVVLWMLRFTLFKLMFMSGVVKIQANCPTWLKLTALEYHYATQCIPTPLAWYAHQLPPFVQQVSVAACLVIEIPLSVLLLAPVRQLRAYASVGQIFLQVLIFLTGNYNFFNFLTMILALTCLDDEYLASLTPPCLKAREEDSVQPKGERGANGALFTWSQFDRLGVFSWVSKCVRSFERGAHGNKLFGALFSAFVALCCKSLFAVTSESSSVRANALDRHRVALSIGVANTTHMVNGYLPYILIPFCAFMILLGIDYVGGNLFAISRGYKVYAFVRFLKSVIVTAVVIGVILPSSCVTFVSISDRIRAIAPPFAFDVYHSSHPWMVTSSYGLFRRMTGMGKDGKDEYGRHVSVVARPEIVLEGSDDGKSWKEIEFQYKPGNVRRRPPLVAPHQPRLDWQMWFAALGNYQGAPWIIHLIDKILEGSKDVIALLDEESYPFTKKPPMYVRSQLYKYDFSRMDTYWNNRLEQATIVGKASDVWWHRSKESEEYTPALEKRNPSIDKFLKQQGWSRPSASKKDRSKRCIRRKDKKINAILGVSFSSKMVCEAVLQVRLMEISFSSLFSIILAGLVGKMTLMATSWRNLF